MGRGEDTGLFGIDDGIEARHPRGVLQREVRYRLQNIVVEENDELLVFLEERVDGHDLLRVEQVDPVRLEGIAGQHLRMVAGKGSGRTLRSSHVFNEQSQFLLVVGSGHDHKRRIPVERAMSSMAVGA